LFGKVSIRCAYIDIFLMHGVKWCHGNLWSRYHLYVVVLCKINWWRFVTLFKSESAGLRKGKLIASVRSVSVAKCLHFLALHHGRHNSWQIGMKKLRHCHPMYTGLQNVSHAGLRT